RVELAQLMHTIYHSSPADSSVRNVVRAIELICRDPQTVASHQQRWDHLNGLLEVMALRWQLRLATNRQRKFAQDDSNQSMRAVELALSTMETLQPELEIDPGDWTVRREILEQRLLRPLRQHRRQLMKQVAIRPS